jgi:hypothetical protein
MGDQGSKATAPTHTTGTRKGEEIAREEGKEPGRKDTGTTGAGRPSGGSSARDSTAVNPESAESDSDSPNMPPA